MWDFCKWPLREIKWPEVQQLEWKEEMNSNNLREVARLDTQWNEDGRK